MSNLGSCSLFDRFSFMFAPFAGGDPFASSAALTSPLMIKRGSIERDGLAPSEPVGLEVDLRNRLESAPLYQQRPGPARSAGSGGRDGQTSGRALIECGLQTPSHESSAIVGQTSKGPSLKQIRTALLPRVEFFIASSFSVSATPLLRSLQWPSISARSELRMPRRQYSGLPPKHLTPTPPPTPIQ